jgi:hypothetical protein
MRLIATAIAPLVIAPSIILASAPPALADSGVKCNQDASYGTTCISLFGTKKGHLHLGNIQAFFSAPNQSLYEKRTWALRLTTYNGDKCSPVGKTKSQCHVVHSYLSRHRRGNPPASEQNCVSVEADLGGAGGITQQHCETYGTSELEARLSDWPRFPKLPHTFTHNTWICVEETTLVKKSWVNNGTPGGKGNRACAEIKG